MARSVVVISGGSRGLGAGIARKCLEAGYTVATFSRSATPFVEQQREQDAEARHFYTGPCSTVETTRRSRASWRR